MGSNIAVFKSSRKLVGVGVSHHFDPNNTMGRDYLVASMLAAECAGCDDEDVSFVWLIVPTDSDDQMPYQVGDVFELDVFHGR